MRASSTATSAPSTQTDSSVDVAAHDAARTPVSAPATARSRAALSSVSAHSASGRESATMPPPTEKCVRPAPGRAEHGERADGDGEVGGHPLGIAGRRVDPPQRTAVDAPAHRLEVFDRLQHARLRCAGHRRGRERRAHQRADADVVAQPAAHRAHEVVQARVRLDRAQLGNVHRSRLADAAEVVAGEVDDHHVLGVVLAAGAQRRARRRGALDRPGLDVAVVAAQVALRRRRHDRRPGAERRGGAAARGGAPDARARARVQSAIGSMASSHVSRRVRLTW